LRRRRNLRKKAISVMFMTFIAISVLTTVFLTMYLYLLRASTMASEAERLYAEAAQERLTAFFYPPAEEASEIGINQVLRIYNRGIGAVIKYIFAFGVRETPLNDENILLGSGENVTIQLQEFIPDDKEIRIVTERGVIFIARVGYFNVSFDPAKLVLYPGQQGVSVLRITSKNYESAMRITITSSDVDYDIIGGTEFYLEKDGIYSLTINFTAPEETGIYYISIRVEDTSTGYFKDATLEIEVSEAAATTLPYFEVTIPNNQKQISGKRGDKLSITFKVIGQNNYIGWVWFQADDPENILQNEKFNPNPVFLSPDSPEKEVTFSFKIRRGASSGTYRIWIIGFDLLSAVLRDSDYFNLTVTG